MAYYNKCRSTLQRLICAIAIVVSLFLLVVVVGLFIPLKVTSKKHCSYCRAYYEHKCTLFIPVSTKLHESSFSSYYKKEVDPQHDHSWDICIWTETYTFKKRNGTTGSLPIYLLKERILMSILSSFNTKEERKAFMEKICEPTSPDEADDLFEKLYYAQNILEDNYKKDSDRRDWPAILAEIGLWP